MPTYEFRCPDGHEFEKFYRTISGAESQAACPVCGLPAERMMSATGFAFKGSGFYLTDYGKNAHRGTAEPAGARDGSSESSKSETASSDSGGGEGKKDSAKSDKASESAPAAATAEPKKSEPKPAESKPAPAAPKPSKSE